MNSSCVNRPMRLHTVVPFLIMICLAWPTDSLIRGERAFYAPMQSSGTTWELLHSDYPEAVWEDVAFLNSTYGWVVKHETESPGSDLLVLHTDDGGDSWQLQYSRSECPCLGMDVIDQNTVWIVGDCLLYTTDGGRSWNQCVVAKSWAQVTTVEFVNRTHGWTGRLGALYETDDGGLSWQSVPGWTFHDDYPGKIVPISSLDIWACSFDATYRSTDGGKTWKLVSDMGGWSMSFVSETEGWIVDDSRLAHMTDGENWTELAVPGAFPWLSLRLMGPYLSDVQFIDKYHGWVVGTETPVMYTPDGGANWYRQSVPFMVTDTRSRVMAICCIDQTHGWAVGWNGVIMRTTSANSLGARLWGGSADLLIFSLMGLAAVAVVGGIYALCRLKHRRTSRNLQEMPRTSTQGPVLMFW